MRKPLSGESLGDVISDEILQEWDFEKNGLTPFDYSRGSLKKGWWKCSYCDHSWETSARSRSNGSKCPICSNIKRDLTATGDWTQVLKYEWDDNNGNPRQFGVGSSKKIKWNCQKCEQSWMASISYRIYRKAKCPYCEGHKAISGKTDFATLYPKLLEEWNFERNNVSPYLILPILGEKIWWICEYKHEWNLSIPQRLKYDTLCPVCSHKVLLRGFNDLITIYPKIAKQWNLEKNINLKPSDFTPRSGKSIWWICEYRHEWKTSISHRAQNKSNCPECYKQKQKTTEKENSFAAKFPELLKKWDKTKNIVDPYSIPISYLEKVWWTDSCEHSWKQTIKSYRKYNKQRCPYCAGRKVLKGFNDLETTHPELVKQWSSKNTVSPSDVSHGYDKRIWWECLKGHEWLVSVNSRTFYNSNCPECSAKTFTSKAEKDLLKFINEILENNQIIENTRKVIHPYELDIYIPEKKIAIEFNGLYWHSEENGKDKNYHYDKWKMCNDKDIQLITIWEDNWRKKNNLIKHMLKHKLSVNDSPKEYGRNTYVEEVGYQESSQFLEKYHIQGAASGSKYIALKSIGKSELLAVSVWTKRKKNFVVLERYATSKTVIGGLGKIISYVQKNEYKNKAIITFADHSVSNGEMYFKLGFKKDKEIPPDYSYIVSDKRIHKFNFRKHNFKNNPNLIYNSSLSESELAKINSMLRIWDCGKTRFILEPPNRLS